MLGGACVPGRTEAVRSLIGMKVADEVLKSLSRSEFRQKQKLGPKDRAYLINKGLDVVTDHAIDFVTKRLGPASPARDGKQTPWRGHPATIRSLNRIP